MTQIQWHEFQDRSVFTQKLADSILENINSSLKNLPVTSVLLSGGSTPKPVYDLLGQMPLPWDRIQVSLTDERCVVDGHPDSNAVMIWQHLLKNHPETAWFSLWQNGLVHGAEATNKAASDRVLGLDQHFGLVLLGMGEDGHFASLFPNCPESDQGLLLGDQAPKTPLVCTHAPVDPKQRISWSLEALLKTDHLVLAITGEKKRQILIDAIEGRANHLPISKLVQQTQTPLSVFWSE